MSKSGDKTFTGPIEETAWPDKLKAHVVTPGSRPQIHGYDVEGDLARHYSFAETVLLALTGELPDKATGCAFEMVLIFIASTPVTEAPAHATVLARLCGAKTAGMLGVGAIALAEQAGFLVDEHEKLLEWMADGNGDLPYGFTATDDEERSSVKRFGESLSACGISMPILDMDPSRATALLFALFKCGIRQKEQIETVFIVSRLPCVMAEALDVQPGTFREYPMNLPPFRYEE